MFLQPKLFHRESGRALTFDADALCIVGEGVDEFLRGALERLARSTEAQAGALCCREVRIALGMPAAVTGKISALGGEYAPNEEGYAIALGEVTEIWAESPAAAVYAVATLQQMVDFGELEEGFLYDAPRSSYRGYRVYVPGRAFLEDFKRMIDLLVYYKFNTLIIQVGGAMEYKRHTEINTTWEKYCAYLTEYPYRFKYHRNKWNYPTCGTHPDAGDGSYLTQEEMRELLTYCWDRKLKVIPEVPSYNHCDYLVMAHPEIRELDRAHDCADGYCPSNPASYELLFDVIDEIVEVFAPEYVHIAHDEVCQINKCEKCRERDAGELFLEDVTKIHDYLASKSVKTMMWGDCMAHPMRNGKPSSGRGNGYCKPGDWDFVPATNTCTGKLPKDILMVDWLLTGIYANTKEIIRSNGYPMVYGNITNPLPGWNECTARLGIPGGIISNWGSNETYYTRKNKNFFALTRMAHAFWGGVEEETDREVLWQVYGECYRYFQKYLTPAIGHPITITHTTDYNGGFGFYFSARKVERSELLLGNYVVMYDDGTSATLPVVYGDNISNENPSRDLLSEVCCCAEPLPGESVTYRCTYENPHPEKNIVSIGFLKILPKDFRVRIKSIRF